MNKKRIEWANEEGSALVLTLMIFLVLTVLATSISFLTVGSFRLSDINRDGTSAFYIAEAGAKKAYEKASQEVMKTYEATTTTTSSDFYAALDALFLNELNEEISFDKQFGDDAKANVRFTATGSNPPKYTLTSTGSVGGKTRTVQKQFDVSWVDKGGSGGFPELPGNTALVTKTSMILKEDVIGDIHSLSTKNDSITIEWVEKLKMRTIFYPKGTEKKDIFVYDPWFENKGFMPTLKQIDSPINWEGYENLIKNYVVPTGITETLQDKVFYAYGGKEHYLIKNGNINFHSGFPTQDDSGRNLSSYTLDVNKNLEFKDIKIESNKTLVINPNGGNRVILVDNLSVMSGDLKIEGEGHVTLVVSDSIKFNQNSQINNLEKQNQLSLVYTGVNANFSQITHFYGNIIIKNSSAKIIVNNSSINGVFITDTKKYTEEDAIVFSGGNQDRPSNMVLIAPFTKIKLTGGYSVKGTVISDEFTIEGGAQLESAPIKTSGFPGISGGATSTPTLEDLLKSGPILEQ